MQMMSVIGHDGTVYTLQRTEDYDGFYFVSELNKLKKKLEKYASDDLPAEYVAEITQFLERAESYGARFNRRRAQAID